MTKLLGILAAVSTIGLGSAAVATPFTTTSPTGGALPSGVTAVGGVVVDLTGTNGNRVVSQVAASTEYQGFPDASEYPLLFATQTGFTSTVLSALGGGISAASFRISLYDGDSQSGDFDYNQNSLLVNGLNFGNFSDVSTQYTDGTGATLYSSGSGFGDDILSTGFFTSTNASLLSSLFGTLSGGAIEFRLADLSPGDQYFDFSQGLDASVINVGSGPVVTPPSGGTVAAVPEPATWGMMILGFGVVGFAMRRKRNVTTRVAYAA